MSVVNTENYAQGGVPTVFEDRTIFPVPQPGPPPGYNGGGAQRRGSPILGFMFVIMLALCAGLAFMLWTLMQSNTKLETQLTSLEKEGTAAQVTALETRIAGLQATIDDYESVAAANAEIQDLERLIGLKLDDIATLIATKPNADKLSDKQKEIDPMPEWRVDTAKDLREYLAYLTTRNNEIAALEWKDRTWTSNPRTGGD